MYSLLDVSTSICHLVGEKSRVEEAVRHVASTEQRANFRCHLYDVTSMSEYKHDLEETAGLQMY